MPIYQIQGPDKRIYEIEGPAGASDAQLINALKNHLGMGRNEMPMPPVTPREPTAPGIGSAFSRGLEQLISTGKTAYGATFGDPRAAMEESLKRREAIGAKYGESPGFEEVKKAYKERGLFPAIGEYISQIPSALAEQTPQIATTLGLARVGSVAGVPGAIAGAVGPSYGLAYGSLLEREAEEQRQRGEAVDPSRAKAAALAVPYAALDVAATFIPLGKGVVKSLFGEEVAKLLSRGATKEAEQLAAKKLSSEGFMKSLGVGTAKGVAVEIPTEIGQQALERFQAGLPLLDESAMAEYGQTAFEVSKLGPFGAAGRLSDKSAARQQVKVFEAEETARKRKEAEAEQERYRQTPEYLQKLHTDFTELSTQEKALRDELKPYQGKKGKKALAALDEEERATILEGFDTLKELRSQLSDIGPEYKKRKPAINAMLEKARVEGMTPEEYFNELHGYTTKDKEKAATETEAKKDAEVDPMQAWLEQTAATQEEGTKEIPTDFKSRLNERLSGLMWARGTGMLDDTSFRNGAVEAIMENPDMAQAVVKGRKRIPGFSKEDSDAIIDALKMQLKELPGKKVAAETEALQRMGERTRGTPEQVEAERLQMRIDEERYALRNIAQDESNPVGVNEKINDILKLLEQKLKAPAIPSEVQRGVGAVESRTAGERVKDREELVRLIEQFRLMQRQKGAARDDTAMTELLEKIRIAAQPVSEEVITEGETKTEEGGAEKSTYLKELNRLREEQDKAFPEALTSILEAERYRRQNPVTTQIEGPTARAKRAAVTEKESAATKRFVDSVLQEIEANRRAADLPSVTAEEVETITGRINNILREAATRRFGRTTVDAEIKKLQQQVVALKAKERTGIYAQLTDEQAKATLEQVGRELERLKKLPGNLKIGATNENALAVLREQIDEIRREASVVERKPKQKGPEYEGRLRRQFNVPAPEGTLAERKEALRGRIEDAVAQYDLPMQDVAVLREAARMLEEGAGSKELVADLEDQMYRFATGNMEMLPEIASQLKLDQSVRAEGEQASLFTPGQQERADVRVMKQRRNFLERRIAERKGKKLTMEGWKAHQAEVDELKQIEKDLPGVVAAGKKAPKATTPYGKEVAPEATAFTRSTSEEFIALVTKAREAREEAAKKANKENKENRAEVPDVKRAMGVLNAHIDAMGARLQVLVNAVKQARRIAERAGRNSPGILAIEERIKDSLIQQQEEQKKLEGYFAGIRRYAKNREIADTTYLQIITKLGKETDAVDKKIKDLEKKDNKTKKENDALTKLKAVRRELQNESGRILELFKSEYKGIEAVINQYKAKIAFVENFFVEAEPDFGVKGGTLDILQGTSEEYLKEYINRNKAVKAALAEATELRKVFDTLLKHRADIISQLAGEERAKAAVKAAEGPTPAERVAASEAEVKRKTGLGLPGVRVERSTITGQIEDAKTAVEEANAELTRLKKERDQAKGQQKAALTRQINKTENFDIPKLEQDLAALEKQRGETKQDIAAEPKETEEVERAKQTVTKERRAKGRALAAERTTEAKEKFEAGFDEFSLAPVVSEARKPKAAAKKLSPPQLHTGMSPEQKASRLKVIVAASKKVANKFATAEPAKKSKAKVAQFDAAAVSDVIKQTVKGKKSKTVYRIGELGAKSIDPVEARRFIDQVVKGLPDSVNFHYAPTLEQAPEKFLDYLVEDGVKLAEGALIKGGVMPDGTVVIIGNAHVSQADMELTLAHELIGHYGIDTLLGKKGMEALLRAVNRRADGIMGLARDLGVEDAIRGVDDIYNQRIAAARARGASAETIAELEKARELTKLREVIADAAERPQRAKEGQSTLGKVQDFLKTLVSAFRTAMYRMGFSSMMEANTSDIYALLRKSSESFERGTIGAYRNPHGDIVFSRKPVTGDNAPTSAWDTVNKVVQSPQSTMDRVRSEATGIGARTAFIDRFAPLEKVAEYMKKSSQAMQMMYYARMHDQRMAWTGATVNGGAPSLSLDEKGNRIITSRGGANMQDIATELSRVKGYGNAEAVRNLFTTYLAAHRALRVGPEKLNFMGNVSAAELAEIRSIGDNIPAFVEARRLYNEYNNGLVDWLVQTGAISKELGRELTRAQDYVPYYRAIGDNVVLEIAGVKPINIGNVQQQPYLRELVGGDQKIQDFFTSALQNTSMLVDMGLRNLATKESAFALREAGLLQNLAGSDKEPKYFGPAKRRPAATNVISWRDNGKDYFAIVNTEPIGIPSELTVKGMHGTLATVGGLTKIMAIPARLLRNMVTRSPLYAARQVVRDSMTNFLLAGGNMTPVASAARELGKMYAGVSEGEKMLQERGIIGGQLLTGTSEDMQKLLLQLSRGGMGWELALAKLDRMHMKADASARITLYNDFRNKQGLSDMEATLATLESMNFSKRGVSSSVYALNMMVPFLNAQIQGLNVLYQAFRGQLPYAEKLQIQRKIVTRGLMMTAATIAYVSMMQDDEAYKNANLRDRLNNWFIKVPGLDEPIKVPIPFEIGIIFKAIPEAALMASNKDEDATKVLSALAGVIANSSPVGISTTMPQAVKPVIEAVSNYNFFTGTNIESQYEQELLPQERFREKTSGLAKGLSNLIGKATAAAGMPSKGVSPIMIDHLVTGYTGSVGLAIAQMIGTMVPAEGATAPAEKRLSDMPVVGSLFQPVDAAGQISQFYDKAKEYGEIKQTFDKLIDEGRVEEAQNFAKEYATRIALADLAEDFKKDMSEFTQLERTIRASDMSPKEKREQLDTIRQAKIQFAKAFNAASRQQ